MRTRSGIALASLLAALLLAGCRSGAVSPPDDRWQVTVSILPQKYFVERIGGDHVWVNVMVGPGSEPHTYEPRPEQLRALSTSRLYLRIGVDFENAWMDKIMGANPNMLVVDTRQGIARLPMSAAHDEDEQDPGQHAEDEGNLDPHIWLSPRLVKIQARTIYEALVQLDPQHEDAYIANLAGFLADIDGLDRSIRETLEPLESRKFLVFHPAWGYFARDYGLEMLAVEIGGLEPSAAELATVIREARQEEIKVIFAQPELSTRDARTIAHEIGGRVLLISPLAEDWLDNLRRVADAFTGALAT
jgi:zinc transport system substrate-binding protein